jgi:hypothetical protein
MTYSCVPALAIHLLERVSPASSLAAAARNWAAGCSLVWADLARVPSTLRPPSAGRLPRLRNH